MRSILILALAASLSACAGSPRIDVCKGAAVRRAAYTAVIIGADAYTTTAGSTAGGTLTREGAVAALAILNANCPVL